MSVVHTFGKLPAKRVIVVGLGKRDRFSIDTVREISGAVARRLKAVGAKRAATIAHGAGMGGLDPAASAQATAEGTVLGLYEFANYRSKRGDDDSGKDVEELAIVERDPQRLEELQRGVAKGCLLAESVLIARDLVNEPANVVNPAKMAETATEIAGRRNLGVTVLGREDMLEHGMGAMLAVAQGTANGAPAHHPRTPRRPGTPRQQHRPGRQGHHLRLGRHLHQACREHVGDEGRHVGRGRGDRGHERHRPARPQDQRLRRRARPSRTCPPARPQRPGDIIRAMSGKTIEVDNTDAEGRLVLADAISYIRQVKGATRVVDVATLTGAIVVALGHVASGVMGDLSAHGRTPCSTPARSPARRCGSCPCSRSTSGRTAATTPT